MTRIYQKLKRFLITIVLVCGLLLPFSAPVAAQYSCDAYGAGVYGEPCASGELSDTGLSVWAVRLAGIGLVLLAVAIIIIARRNRNK